MSRNMGRLALIVVAAGLLTIGGGVAAVYAQSTSTVVMNEFSFTPDRMVVSAGRDTFTLQNSGQFPHNVHIEGNGVSVDVKADGPVAVAKASPARSTLAPGTYDVWCPVSNHKDRGMVGTLTVAGTAAGGAAQVPTPCRARRRRHRLAHRPGRNSGRSGAGGRRLGVAAAQRDGALKGHSRAGYTAAQYMPGRRPYASRGVPRRATTRRRASHCPLAASPRCYACSGSSG